MLANKQIRNYETPGGVHLGLIVFWRYLRFMESPEEVTRYF